MKWDKLAWRNHDESLNIYKLITIIQIVMREESVSVVVRCV